MKLRQLAACVTVALMTTVASAQDTVFIYQGELNENGSPYNGSVNIAFTLFDSVVGGTMIGVPYVYAGLPVVDGKFSVEIDYGAEAFADNRWLEIEVNGVPLTPRTPITRAPYAIQTRGIFVDDSGDVGIGTTNPDAGLHVKGVGGYDSAIALDNITGGLQWSLSSWTNGNFSLIKVTGDAFTPFAIEPQFGHVGISSNALAGMLQEEFTHALVIKKEDDDNVLRLLGPDGSFRSGARLNFGDSDYVYLDEDEDDNLTINARLRTAIMGGDVGVGTTSPSFKLEVNGTAGKPGGGSWSNSSDRRLKKNIQDLSGTLEKLLALRGVSFEYKDPASINEFAGKRIGMIAQELEKVFPDWVETRKDGYKAVTYRGFEALTVEALRELRDEKDVEIAALRAENDALRKRLDSVEALVEQITKPDAR